MKQFYAQYKDWEDYNNGMYCLEKKPNESELINDAISLLSDADLFYQVCKRILFEWSISTKVNLTNRQCNRKAWLGQAACSFKFGVPETLTRIAWGRMTKPQQIQADSIALKIINHFEINYERKDQELHFRLAA